MDRAEAGKFEKLQPGLFQQFSARLVGSIDTIAIAARNFPDMIPNRVTVLEDKSNTEDREWEDRHPGIACAFDNPVIAAMRPVRKLDVVEIQLQPRIVRVRIDQLLVYCPNFRSHGCWSRSTLPVIAGQKLSRRKAHSKNPDARSRGGGDLVAHPLPAAYPSIC